MGNLLITAATAWIAAQSVKVLWGLAKYGSKDISRIPWRIVWAGGMPSAHSAVVTATTISILYHSGVQSMAFGLSLIFSCIVIYDRLRMHAIYSTFQNRYPLIKEEIQGDPRLADLVGHTAPEVIVGGLTGACVGFMAGASEFNGFFHQIFQRF